MKVGQKIWAATTANLTFSTVVCPVTTVASFTANSVVLNLACTANGTANVGLYWGDDDGPTLNALALQCVDYQLPSGVYILTSRGFMNTKPACATTGTAAALTFPFPALSGNIGDNTGFYITPDFNYADCTGSNGVNNAICIGAGLGQLERLLFSGTGLTSASNSNCANAANKALVSPGANGGVLHNIVVAGVCPGATGMAGVDLNGLDAYMDEGGGVDTGQYACRVEGGLVFLWDNDCTNADVTGGDGLIVAGGTVNDMSSYQYENTVVVGGATFNGHGTHFTAAGTSGVALTLNSGAISTHDGDTFACGSGTQTCLSATGTARVSMRNATMTSASNSQVGLTLASGATFIDQGGNQTVGTPKMQIQTVGVSQVMGDQIIQGVCQGTATASSTLGLYGAGENSTPNCTSTTVNLGTPMLRAGNLMGLAVNTGTGGVSASSGVFTVMKTTAGTTSATTLTCTTGTGTICGDAVHNVAYAVGDVISIQFTTQGSETLANIKAEVLAW